MKKLFELANVRAGDKGDTCILALIPFDSKDFAQLQLELSEEKIAKHFGNTPENVTIHNLEYLFAFTIVIRKQLDGGVTRSRSMDRHGKTFGSHLLDLEVEMYEKL